MVKQYISTFNNDISWIRKGIALEVGAARRDRFIYTLRDNTGDNISADNEYWGELTGLYWIWKNMEVEDDMIIGFAHYNKVLNVSDKKVETFLKGSNNKWIVAQPITIPSHKYPDDINILSEILRNRFEGKYFVAWNELYEPVGGDEI